MNRTIQTYAFKEYISIIVSEANRRLGIINRTFVLKVKVFCRLYINLESTLSGDIDPGILGYPRLSMTTVVSSLALSLVGIGFRFSGYTARIFTGLVAFAASSCAHSFTAPRLLLFRRVWITSTFFCTSVFDSEFHSFASRL